MLEQVFGDIVNCDLALDLPEMWWEGLNLIDCLVKMREGQARLIEVTQDFLDRKLSVKGL